MNRLIGRDVYLATLERADCRRLWEMDAYDFDHPAEEPNLGHSAEKADAWFDEIQKLQGRQHVRLGIFLRDGAVIGDVALQDIDWKNRVCSLGMGFSRLEDRGKGYGAQAAGLMLDYGFRLLGLERIAANTLSPNRAAQRSLEKLGMRLEGVERRAVLLCGERVDRLHYGLLRDEFLQKS